MVLETLGNCVCMVDVDGPCLAFAHGVGLMGELRGC